MSQMQDLLKAGVQKALQDGHAPAMIKTIKSGPYSKEEFTNFAKAGKIPAVVEKTFGKLKNKGVNYRNQQGQTGQGVVIGAIGDTVDTVMAVVYDPDKKAYEYVSSGSLSLSDAVGGQDIVYTVTEYLMLQGYDNVASDVLTGPNLQGRVECFLIPGSTPNYKIYLNLLEIHNSMGVADIHFYIGTQIITEAETKIILNSLQRLGIENRDQAALRLIQNIPAQVSITPLIRLSHFLQKLEIEDLGDCSKILKFYAYDMHMNNLTEASVTSITSSAIIKSTVEDLRASIGMKKAEAEATVAKSEEHWVDFEIYKQKLVSLICNNGFEVITARNGTFVFYDNSVYRALLKSVFEPALVLKAEENNRVSAYQHKMLLGYMAIPPVFVDLDDNVLLPIDGYTTYRTTAQSMGKFESPVERVHRRNQNEWASFVGAMKFLSTSKGYSPDDIAILLNLALA